ncbi:hypothetical protein D3C75_1132600 [compost metagenome]
MTSAAVLFGNFGYVHAGVRAAQTVSSSGWCIPIAGSKRLTLCHQGACVAGQCIGQARYRNVIAADHLSTLGYPHKLGDIFMVFTLDRGAIRYQR